MRYFVAVFAVILLFVPFKTTSSTTEDAPYETKTSQSSFLDIGELEVRTEGRVGKRELTVSTTANILTRVLNGDSLNEKPVDSRIITKPVDKHIVEGARRYQYMVCSGGGYMYFTDEQFAASKSIGYTSKSPDACAANGVGYKLYLSHSKPIERSRGGAICRDGWRSYSTGRGTCSHHGGVAYWL